MTPVVTVVIPVYNGENYLHEAIDSVLQQTFKDVEVIVVDDGSTDSTGSIVEHYAEQHPALVRGLRKENGGTATALNAGIRAAKGKYVAWLSHDDRFVPHKLETQLRILREQPEVVGIYSDYAYIDAAGKQIGGARSTVYPPTQMMRHLLQCVFINGSTLLIERRCFEEVGYFDETLRYTHDAMMWLKLVDSYQLAYCPETLSAYRLHATQQTHTSPAIRSSLRAWLDRMVEEFSLEQIFPELRKPQTTAVERAEAYTYLGDVFVLCAVHPRLGLQQYWQSLKTWPHPANPVVPSMGRMLRFMGRHALNRLRQGPTSDTIPFVQSEGPLFYDLSEVAETVEDYRRGARRI